MTWEEAKARLERAAPAFDAATPQLAADIRAALQRVAEQDANARMMICLWCGETFDAGVSPQEAQGHPELLAPAYEWATSHDQQCEKNPLRQRVAELERGRQSELLGWKAAEAEVSRLRAALDRADCTQREGGDTRHCAPDRLCWRCRAGAAEQEAKRLEGLIVEWWEAPPNLASEHAAGLALGAEARSAREREARNG